MIIKLISFELLIGDTNLTVLSSDVWMKYGSPGIQHRCVTCKTETMPAVLKAVGFKANSWIKQGQTASKQCVAKAFTAVVS